MRKLLNLTVVLVLAACGSDNNVANPNNANNDNNGSNNSTSGSNNASNNANNVSNNASNNVSNNGPNNTTNNRNNGTCEALDPAIGDCDPVCQTGCEVGEHCLVDADAMATCGPAGPRVQDEACNADTECALGLHCRSVGGSMDRTCLNYCNPDGDPGCPSNHACVRLQADNRIGACVPITNDCDAVPADSCTDPDECYDTIQGRKCLPAGMVAADEECVLSSDCAPGLRCVTVMDVGQVCKPICDPDGADDQCTGGMCRALSSPAGQPLTWGACY